MLDDMKTDRDKYVVKLLKLKVKANRNPPFPSGFWYDMTAYVNSTLQLKIEHLLPIAPPNQCMGVTEQVNPL